MEGLLGEVGGYDCPRGLFLTFNARGQSRPSPVSVFTQGTHTALSVRLPLRVGASREGEAVPLPRPRREAAFTMATLGTIIFSGGNCECNVNFRRKPRSCLRAVSLQTAR